MATETKSQADPKKTPKQEKKPLVPPDEKFWQRYSAHHEFPLSSLGSVLLHMLAFGMVAFVMWWWFSSINDELKPLPLEPLAIGGGGGNPNGMDNNPGKVLAKRIEAPDLTKPKVNIDPNDLTNDKIKFNPVTPKTPKIDIPPDARFFDTSDPIKQLAALKKQIEQTKIQGPLAPKGQGGAGSGGGQGAGVGPGKGNSTGPGTGNLSPRMRRQLRRTIMFSTLSGDDYRQQLRSLGAVLAVPASSNDNPNLYLVIRDLNSYPAQGKLEDINELNRKLNCIFWTDTDPQSVGTLAHALGLPSVPPNITAFFPHDFEQDLLKKELEFRHVKSEWDIRETVFRIVMRGGRYVAEVERQRLLNDD
jgi:hypothetical protein